MNHQMIIIYKQIQKVFLAVLFLTLILETTAPVVLATTDTGLDITAKQGYGGPNESSTILKTVPEIIGTIVGAGLAFLGIVFLILMIYGGWIWMFAQGNEKEVEKAKGLITSAIIGLLIVLGAYAITAYVGSAVGQEIKLKFENQKTK
ncbi:MAG: hypothetical protein AAB653_01450 [Patescibacteria group bacterium]